MKKRKFFSWIIHVALVVSFSLCIVYSDRLHCLFSPKNYWHGKIVEFNNYKELNTYKIKSLSIYLARAKALKKYSLQEAEAKSKVLGIDINAAIANIYEEHKKDIEGIKKAIEIAKKEHKKNAQRLDDAYCHYQACIKEDKLRLSNK